MRALDEEHRLTAAPGGSLIEQVGRGRLAVAPLNGSWKVACIRVGFAVDGGEEFRHVVFLKTDAGKGVVAIAAEIHGDRAEEETVFELFGAKPEIRRPVLPGLACPATGCKQ